jgi:hypothetical protein
VQSLQRRAQLIDERLIHLGGGDFLTHQVLNQRVEAHVEPFTEHGVSALPRPGAGVARPVVELGFEDRFVDLLEDLLSLLFRLVVGNQIQVGLPGSSRIDIQTVLPRPRKQLLAGVDPHRAAVHHGHGPPGVLSER